MIARVIFGGLVAVAAAVALTAPNAVADNVCVGVMNQSGCNPAPWNGQLMETWNTPGLLRWLDQRPGGLRPVHPAVPRVGQP